MQLNLREKIKNEEFDANILYSNLSQYSKPRDKVSNMMKKGEIIQILKGFYVWGDVYRKRLISVEILSNMISNPSYISLDYALSHYGLIPERVNTVTAICLGGRSRFFKSPLINFSYQQLNERRYYLGIRTESLQDGRRFIIASKEKALADKVYFSKGIKINNQADIAIYLFEDLRILPEDLLEINLELFGEIANLYNSMKVSLLNSFLHRKINEYL